MYIFDPELLDEIRGIVSIETWTLPLAA